MRTKKLWTMKVTVVCALGERLKRFEKSLRELGMRRIMTIHTTELLRSARILGRVLETLGLTVALTLVKDYQLILIGKIQYYVKSKKNCRTRK